MWPSVSLTRGELRSKNKLKQENELLLVLDFEPILITDIWSLIDTNNQCFSLVNSHSQCLSVDVLI